MQRTLEQDLVNAFIENITKCANADGKSCKFVQIETGATAIGVPDLLMFYNHKLYWIEAKRFRCAPKQGKEENYIGEVVFRPGQLRFLRRLYNARENVFVLALTEWMDAVIIPIFKIPETTGAVLKFSEKGADLPSTYEYMKEMLK